MSQFSKSRRTYPDGGTVDVYTRNMEGGTMTHTPGPWRAVDKFGIRGMGTGIIVDDAHMLPENARLIAAAPDMLAALKHAVEYLDGWPRDSQQRPCLEKVRAAIAKAEGRK